MLWALDNKTQRLSIPERHPPTSGYTLAWQGRALRNEQHDDLGFWSEALLANAAPSGQWDPSINWLTLPSDGEDSLAALRTIAQLWGLGLTSIGPRGTGIACRSAVARPPILSNIPIILCLREPLRRQTPSRRRSRK